MSSIAIAGSGSGRTILSANTNYYVTTTGSDSNNGSIGAPWATLQHAMNIIATTLDIGGFTITVHIGAGSFAGFGQQSTIGGGQINWIGAGSASTTLTAGAGPSSINNGEVFSAYYNTNTVFGIDGMTLSNTSASSFTIVDFFNTSFHMYWGPSGAVDLVFDVPSDINLLYDGGSGNTLNLGNSGGTITINYSPANAVRGSPTLQMLSNGTILDSGITWALTGNPTYVLGSTPFVYFNQGGVYNGLTTFTGTASGASVNLNSESFWSSGSFAFPTSTLGFVDSSSGVLSGGATQDESLQGFVNFNDALYNVIYHGLLASGLGIPTAKNAIVNGGVWGIFKASDGPRALLVNDGGTAYLTQIGKNINAQTASYTLAILDTDGIVEMNVAGANNLTVDTDANNITNFHTTFPVGTKISVVQAGAGATTVVAAVGVTVHNAGAVGGQWKSALLYKRAANEWVQLNGAF